MEPGFVEFVELEMPLKFRQEFCYNFAFPYFFLPQMMQSLGVEKYLIFGGTPLQF